MDRRRAGPAPRDPSRGGREEDPKGVVSSWWRERITRSSGPWPCHADGVRGLTRFGGVRFDPAARVRSEVAKLRALGVALHELQPASAERVFDGFVRDFVDEDHKGAVRSAFDERRAHKTLWLERYLRADTIRSRAERSLVSFLTRRGRDARIVRFDRRTGIPAIEIVASTLEDTWASSWPGLFVGADGTRAVVVTSDYAELRCATGTDGATPYR